VHAFAHIRPIGSRSRLSGMREAAQLFPSGKPTEAAFGLLPASAGVQHEYGIRSLVQT
jgi:hypothetical protein